MTTHQEARRYATDGFRLAMGREPTLPEVQCMQAVGWLETRYGDGWTRPGAVGSHNIGAIQAGSRWQGATFEHADSSPQPDGTNKWYTTKFRKYDDPADGWADLARIMYRSRPTVLAAASAGDTYGVSAAMYETTYFEGTGPDAATRISRHHKALMRGLTAAARAFGEQLPDGTMPPPATIKVGDTGEAVKELQRLLGAVADGIFGPATDTMVKAFQSSHGLKDDGIVGPVTWAKLLERTDAAPVDEVNPVKATDELLERAVALKGQLELFIDARQADVD